MSLEQLIFLVATYFVAAIPFGLVLAKIFANVDIRKAGSKNIGATNVTRIVGKKLGLATFVLDALKGAIMVLLARYYFAENINLDVFLSLTAFVAVLGHIFPIYLNFKGGKGVATSVAVLLAINPIVGLAVIFVWLLVFLIAKTSSLSSLSAVFASLFAAYFSDATYAQSMLCLAIFVIVTLRHEENILRLVSGKEKALVAEKKPVLAKKNVVKNVVKTAAKTSANKVAKKVVNKKSANSKTNVKRKNSGKNPAKR